MSRRSWRRWIAALPAWVELAVVLGITFGPFVWRSTQAALTPEVGGRVFTDAVLWGIAVQELVVGGLAVALLRARGKRLGDYGTRVSVGLVAAGPALVAATYAAYFVAFQVLVHLVDGEVLASRAPESRASLVAIAALVLVNPLFEELFVAGYVLSSLRERWGGPAALFASVALRMSYHTYQGPVGVVSNLCVGVVLGLVYLRWRQLCPLVVAHALMDAVGLAAA